ncbi:ankyrin repeat domain-containing protein [Wolbachia endosymbiont of Diaphorina citri]|nr:ankyrin repeat domain-containing protein [Wolbachia endosymbiont of Diaphorina citri]QJT96554.1 ankyrin repeat domain-containing protein [Wolbachia endosymbiont of Diaphorina citri]QLK11741.1 ankyrin repeat domain-containing protein [Wolbachia endosymbiont of Diaphorina citri]QXY86633.1 ankyrin repeat domain-containing protein [Wolbachia endosymbiont of Diaphorina citri]QXY87843.1 ankyrin repeat domain-containing protein [Wolbachia endosymbiont of Diaphorina citri]QXY89921.1 ankyrin repeat 
MLKKVLNMNRDSRNKLHFWWCITMIICVVITYCYTKAKATDNYKTILQIASKNCSLEVVKFSANNLLDINTQIPELTALHYASGAGCLEVVKFLIEEGADINTAKYEKWTALHAASYKGNLEIIKLLLEKGANPNIRDTGGKNPRDVAVLRSRHNKDKPYDEIIHLLYNAEKKHESEQ